MMLCMLPFSVFAQENDSTEATMENTQSSSASPSQGESSAEETIGSVAPTRGLGELSTIELATMEVNAEDIPEVIPMARALEKGLVNRLYAQEENLSMVLFQTKSGNKTAYVFGKPVKYVDARGNVQDKSTAISAMLDTTYAYAMLDNSVKVYFPKNVTSGVLLAYNGYSITTTPEVSGSFAPIYHEESNAVGYVGVFGSTSILTYTPTLYGVKEDIVLVKYEGKNSFDFIMTAQGLNAVKNQDGIWELRNGEGKAIANLGNVIIKDSAGKTTEGELSVVSLGNSQYRVTVNAPEEFLLAEDTVYPVYVDPTTTIYEDAFRDTDDYLEEYVDTIIDVGLYESSTDYNYAISHPESHMLGMGMDYCRVIYKFYDFYGEHGWFTELGANQIGSVKLYVNAYNTDPITATAVPMTATWSGATNPVALLESTANLWNSVNTTYGASSIDISSDGSYAIDITQIARGWAFYNQGESTQPYNNPANGFCLMSNSHEYVQLQSSEAASYNNVYYEIDYIGYDLTYYIVSKINPNRYQCLQRYYDGEEYVFVIDDFSANIDSQWEFEYLGTNSAGVERYRIYSAANNNEYLRVLAGSYVSSGTVMSPENVWLLEPVTGGYRIRSEYSPTKYLHNNNGSLGLTTNQSSAGAVWELLWEPYFVPVEDFKLNMVHIPKGTTQQLSAVNLTDGATHTNNSYFHFALESGSNFAITSAGSVTAPNADNESAYVTVTHKYTGAERTIGVFTTENRKVVKLQNSTLNFYLGISTTVNVEGESYITAGNINVDRSTLWYFIPGGTQTYNIMNAENHTFIGIEGDSFSEGVYLVEKKYPTQWKIVSNTDSEGTVFHRITPVDGSLSFYMDFGVTASKDKIKLSSNQGERSKWFLYSIIYDSPVNVLYDKAYSDRYGSGVHTKISDCLDDVRRPYVELFGLWLDYSTPTRFTSYADDCTNDHVEGSSDYANNCACTNGSQHKFINNIIQVLTQSASSSVLTIAFSGHQIYKEDGSLDDKTKGIATLNGYACLITRNEPDNDYISKTCAHEVAHLFGAEHHEGTVGDYNDFCMMTSTKNKEIADVITHLPLCVGCRNDMVSTIGKFDD